MRGITHTKRKRIVGSRKHIANQSAGKCDGKVVRHHLATAEHEGRNLGSLLVLVLCRFSDIVWVRINRDHVPSPQWAFSSVIRGV